MLVNNAGYSQSGAIESVPMDEVRRQFETNVFGLVRMSQLVLPAMRAQRAGRIVNVCSMGANFTFPGGGFYHATKYAVEAISDALRFEVRGFGIDVVDHPARDHPDQLRRGGGDRVRPDAEAEGPYGGLQRGGREGDAGASTPRAPLAHLGGAPEAVAKVDRAGDHLEVAEDPLPRDASAHAAHRPARADDGRHVGPDGGDPVPAAGGVAIRARGALPEQHALESQQRLLAVQAAGVAAEPARAG